MQLTQARLADLLARVQKPARYAGGEWNSIAKAWEGLSATLALAYPDLYEIGMSNLGLSILYDLVNRRADLAAERVFTPWTDLESAMRAEGVPLFSLETHRTLDEFDVIGFSLQHELNYTNVLQMLDLAGLPIQAADRDGSLPLVIGGGSCTYNAEPLAAFFDAFAIGEGEEVLLELLDVVAAWKREAGAERASTKRELLRQLAQVPGVYVPSLYTPTYGEDGELLGYAPVGDDAPPRVAKRIMPTLGPVPTAPIVPGMEAVHDRAVIEIQRGCSRGCRFCQAGIIYRPIRERPAEETLQALADILDNTGHGEVSFVSLSSSDHSEIEQLVTEAIAQHSDCGLGVSLPSLRIDSFSVRLAERIQSVRKSGFTFAPEAGSQRLRDVINKGVTEEDLVRTAEAAFASGWNRIKLYFMIGLPTETDEDVEEIARLVGRIRELGRTRRGRRVQIGVSVSTFVPKPHTPFQWSPLADRETIARRQGILRGMLRGREVSLSWSEWESTLLEAALARGDRRMGAAIAGAWRGGARFDAWREHLSPTLWAEAFAAERMDMQAEASRPRSRDEALPWDVLDTGVTRGFLWREYERALDGGLSPDCRETCHGCGITAAYAGARAEAGGRWGCP